MKKIVLLLFCMLIYMPATFASTWQEDVDERNLYGKSSK